MAARAGATQWQQQGIAASAAVARTGVAWQHQWRQGQQQGPGRGQRGGNNSSKIGGDTVTTAVRTIARETQRDEGNAVTTTGYCGNGGGEVDSDGGGESEGSAGTTVGYRGNGGGGNKDNSKGNSGKNQERGGNNGGGVSHLSLIFFFLVGPQEDTGFGGEGGGIEGAPQNVFLADSIFSRNRQNQEKNV